MLSVLSILAEMTENLSTETQKPFFEAITKYKASDLSFSSWIYCVSMKVFFKKIMEIAVIIITLEHQYYY